MSALGDCFGTRSSGARLDWEFESDGETLVISPSGPLVANVIEMEVVLCSPGSSALRGRAHSNHCTGRTRADLPILQESPNSPNHA
ncbi:LysR family transcriptional regulator domain-containing protein [Rhizobium gallicum bv. gallicum R602sp]|uniref:LysR family transcriptional regulator domain-containing protein n=1 Tax=Rhizobium gallicum bv. gallicum R602sp TaxID=1041138 RepID=A0A0B4X474_9HYPH|nr:hypothetical protein [Rhizobium gallicum]AJD41931.1 LysR family transcriptional regulator domain-containing protein [Rhizobium gallicum bv. gallicum R602sp]